MTAHPEGGYFVETWRHRASAADEDPDAGTPGTGTPGTGTRGAGTSIYFLLARGQSSRWHRVDAAEIWHFYAGTPLLLEVWAPGDAAITRVLLCGALDALQPGPVTFADGVAADVVAPQFVVPPGAWQRAAPMGAFTLVGCTVSPAFVFEAFELAPEAWSPPLARGG